MKTHYVYQIIDNSGKILHIGKTMDLERRFAQHTKWKGYGDSSAGLFYGRTNIKLEIVKEFNDKKECTKFEGEYKIQNGFIWTEKEQWKDFGRKSVESGHLKRVRTGPNGINNQLVRCPDGHITNHAWKKRYCEKHNLDVNLCERIK